jgi:hypothetical protein
LSKEEYLQNELECEEVIMNDKQRFGRVRTNVMKHLRLKYSEKTANRSLSRINKRASKGSLRSDVHLKELSMD